MSNTLNYDYNRLLSHFYNISKIPHGSGNLSGITQYIIEFCKALNLEYKTDSFGNIFIFKNGIGRNTNNESIILQAHIDMVCTSDLPDYDMKSEPVKLVIDSKSIHTNGTSLGADNGIGVSLILSVLENNNIEHPPLEAVFTSDEEIGMDGARMIRPELLNSKILINLDSEEEDVVTIGCAGGERIDIAAEISEDIKYINIYQLDIDGLLGGHSGIDIDKNRANSNCLMLDLLTKISANNRISISSFSGGEKDNAIPVSSSAVISSENIINLESIINDFTKLIKEQYPAETGFKIKISNIESSEKFYNIYEFMKICSAIPSGPLSFFNNNVETSSNFAICNLFSGELNISFSIRSFDDLKRNNLADDIKNTLNTITSKYVIRGQYPAWKPNFDSTLLRKYINAYNDIKGDKPSVSVIHAGLECGVFADKIDGIEAISIGPNIFNVHTTREYVEFDSIRRFANIFIHFLEM